MVNPRYFKNKASVVIKPIAFVPAKDRFKAWTSDEYWDWVGELVGAEKRDQIKQIDSETKFLDFTDQMHLPFASKA